ncbi:Leucine-rich receptor-like protein kinase family protein [Rhynchospora pubera]|uniref:Leucine-rich receptor-like protein kinase family protein n=1 Tax=Rhynchospora pubera TaxID=906938 RepID=A0AAV8EMV0_9POAL|nr:Leucine-rich receptor-like protein kinase family protein [Rhynchospora pubera]
MVTRPLSCFLPILLFCAISAKAGDVDLLISFKNSLPDPNMLSNWNRTHAVCQFQGITCKSGHVSSLMIHDLPLTADFSLVSTYILPLPNLQTLTLHSTNITGSISKPTNCTVKLKELDIFNNGLHGSVSDAVSLADSCRSLQSLNLSDNFIGQAFHSFPSISLRIKMLDLSYNNIVSNSDIQWLFSNLGLLKYLDLSNNNIQGTIPDGLVNCTNLNWISLESNRLTGSIPNWIGRLQKLVVLVLRNNSFTGMIPPELGNCKGLDRCHKNWGG